MAEPLDLSGRRFGRLTVLGPHPEPHLSPDGSRYPRWICRCDCGNETVVQQRSLLAKNGPTRSCGCLRREKALAAAENLSGRRFGHWLVLRREETEKPYANGNVNGWYCRCDCGTERILDRASLVFGRSASCGCVRGEKSAERVSTAGGNVFGRYQGTTVTAIKPGLKLLSNNRSGVRGVYWEKQTQRWVAAIGFRGRTIKLGRFTDKEEAVKARKLGEERYFAPVIAAYEAEKACAGPAPRGMRRGAEHETTDRPVP